MFVFQTSVNIRKAEADKSNPLFSTSSVKSTVRQLLLILMAAPSYNTIFSTSIATGSVDSYDERYREVRATLADDVSHFGQVKLNPFWLLKEVNYWLVTWNGFMATYLLFPPLPSEAYNKDKVQEQQDDRRICATFDSMSCSFDAWRNCCCPPPIVITSHEDVRLRYLHSYASMEMLHAPYTRRFILLFDQFRQRIHTPRLPFFLDAPEFDPLGSCPTNRFHFVLRPVRFSRLPLDVDSEFSYLPDVAHDPSYVLPRVIFSGPLYDAPSSNSLSGLTRIPHYPPLRNRNRLLDSLELQVHLLHLDCNSSGKTVLGCLLPSNEYLFGAKLCSGQRHILAQPEVIVWGGQDVKTRCQVILDAAIAHLDSWYFACQPPSDWDDFFLRSFPSLRFCGDILNAGVPSNYDLWVKQWPKAIFLAQLKEFYSAMSDASLSCPLHLLLAGFDSPLPFEALIPTSFWPWRLPNKTISVFEVGEALMILRHNNFQVSPDAANWSAVELSILPTSMLPQSIPPVPTFPPFRPLDRILAPSRKEHPLYGKPVLDEAGSVPVVVGPFVDTALSDASSPGRRVQQPANSLSSGLADSTIEVVADGSIPQSELLFLPGTRESDQPDFIDLSTAASPGPSLAESVVLPNLALAALTPSISEVPGPSVLSVDDASASAPLQRSTRGKGAAIPSSLVPESLSAQTAVVAGGSAIMDVATVVPPGQASGVVLLKSSKTTKSVKKPISTLFPLPRYAAGPIFGATISMPFTCGRYVSISCSTGQPIPPKVKNPVRVYPTKFLKQPIMQNMLHKVPHRFQGSPTLPLEVFCACFNFSVALPKTWCLLPEDLESTESLDISWEKQAAIKANKVFVQENRPKLKSPYDRPSYNFSSTTISSQLPTTASSSSNAVPSLPQASSNLDEVSVISEALNMGLDTGVHPPLNPAFVNAPSVVPSSSQGWFIPTGLLSDGDDIISPTSAPAADVVMLDVGSRDDSMGANVGLSNDVRMSDFEMPAIDGDNEHLVDGKETFAFVEGVREVEMLPLDDLLDLSGYDDDMEVDELLPSETGTSMVRELSLPPVATLDVSIFLPLAIPMPQLATPVPITFARPPLSSSNSSVPEQWHLMFALPAASVGDLSDQSLLDATAIDRWLALAGMNSGAEEDQIAADLMDVDSLSDKGDSRDLGTSDSDLDSSDF
ncbi:hypothetical protein C8J56DRAFT_1062962 [Mycena floridula]|nr:hypothetical protein C8J56DRAFT_1062962 [Mycena floridula]